MSHLSHFLQLLCLLIVILQVGDLSLEDNIELVAFFPLADDVFVLFKPFDPATLQDFLVETFRHLGIVLAVDCLNLLKRRQLFEQGHNAVDLLIFALVARQVEHFKHFGRLYVGLRATVDGAHQIRVADFIFFCENRRTLLVYEHLLARSIVKFVEDKAQHFHCLYRKILGCFQRLFLLF